MCLTNKPLQIALDLTMTNWRLCTRQKYKYKQYPFGVLRKAIRKNKWPMTLWYPLLNQPGFPEQLQPKADTRFDLLYSYNCWQESAIGLFILHKLFWFLRLSPSSYNDKKSEQKQPHLPTQDLTHMEEISVPLDWDSLLSSRNINLRWN